MPTHPSSAPAYASSAHGTGSTGRSHVNAAACRYAWLYVFKAVHVGVCENMCTVECMVHACVVVCMYALWNAWHACIW